MTLKQIKERCEAKKRKPGMFRDVIIQSYNIFLKGSFQTGRCASSIARTSVYFTLILP
jgi:hypothetical protein